MSTKPGPKQSEPLLCKCFAIIGEHITRANDGIFGGGPIPLNNHTVPQILWVTPILTTAFVTMGEGPEFSLVIACGPGVAESACDFFFFLDWTLHHGESIDSMPS